MSTSNEASAAGPSAARQAYRAMLERLCIWTQVPSAERDAVLASESLTLGGIPIALQLEEWSSFVKVLVDVGKPAPQDAPGLHRYLLNQQLQQPVPFYLVPAVDPETDHVVLLGSSPLPQDHEADERFFAFLQGCAYVCDTLRANAPHNVEATV